MEEELFQLGLGLRFLKRNLFDNSRQERLGIVEHEKEISQNSIKSFHVGGPSQEFNLTSSFTEVTGMSITHTSKTGKVLILFSCTVSNGSVGGTYQDINIKLQKDGVDVAGTQQEIYPGHNLQEENSYTPCTIHYVETNADKNTWRIVAKKQDFGGASDGMIDDRILTIIDL